MNTRHVIIGYTGQYSEARGNCDFVFTMVQWSDGRRETLRDDNPELVEFFSDRDAYWNKRGWESYFNPCGQLCLARTSSFM